MWFEIAAKADKTPEQNVSPSEIALAEDVEEVRKAEVLVEVLLGGVAGVPADPVAVLGHDAAQCGAAVPQSREVAHRPGPPPVVPPSPR